MFLTQIINLIYTLGKCVYPTWNLTLLSFPPLSIHFVVLKGTYHLVREGRKQKMLGRHWLSLTAGKVTTESHFLIARWAARFLALPAFIMLRCLPYGKARQVIESFYLLCVIVKYRDCFFQSLIFLFWALKSDAMIFLLISLRLSLMFETS